VAWCHMRQQTPPFTNAFGRGGYRRGKKEAPGRAIRVTLLQSPSPHLRVSLMPSVLLCFNFFYFSPLLFWFLFLFFSPTPRYDVSPSLLLQLTLLCCYSKNPAPSFCNLLLCDFLLPWAKNVLSAFLLRAGPPPPLGVLMPLTSKCQHMIRSPRIDAIRGWQTKAGQA